MTRNLPKLWTLARRPVVWLSVVAFVVWLVFLRWVTPPPPAYTIATGEAADRGPFSRSFRYAVLKDVSDDGWSVTYEVVSGHGRMYSAGDTHPHRRTRDGADVTPTRWADVDGSSVPEWHAVWRSELWGHPEGRAFLYDEPAWANLKKRFPTVFTDGAGNFTHFGPLFTFSPDGRLLAYHTRNGDGAHRRENAGITIYDSPTGRRVAFLRGQFDRIHLAPGGRTAITKLDRDDAFGELPRLQLWDLDTATVRSELRLPHDAIDVRFSPDGRFVFTRCWAWMSEQGQSVEPLRWWDTATGRQVGEVNQPADFALTAGGRVLVTRMHAEMRIGKYLPARLAFWDVETGESRGEWAPEIRSRGWKSHTDFLGSGGERYLAVEYDPESGGRPYWFTRAGQAVLELITRRPPPERDQVVVFDTADRCEVMRVPGKHPALSANGRWLATIDSDGLIRVWEVPAGKPWTHMLGLAAVLGVGTVVAGVLAIRGVRWCRKRRWRQWVFGGGISLVLSLAGLLTWDDAASEQGDAELSAVYSQLPRNDGPTVAELTATIGRPPTVVPAGNGRPGTCHRWTSWGGEGLEVEFNSEGKAELRSCGGGRPLEGRIASWFGW